MSDKIRYFQNNTSGMVYPEENLAASVTEPGHPHYTEVQVVPLDAIVIRRDELPKRENLGRWSRFDGVDVSHTAPTSTPDVHEARARAHLAAAEYLREFPTEVEAQVEALAEALSSVDTDILMGNETRIARHLIASGRVRVGDDA